MSSILNNRQGLRNPLNNNESALTSSRKRPAASISNTNGNTTTANKRPQPHRMSIAMDRLQLNTKYIESMGPQRHTLVDSNIAIEAQQLPTPMPRPSVFALQNSRRASSFVRNPTISSIPERVIQKFNAPDKTPPRRPTTDMKVLKEPGTQRKLLKAVVEYLNESHYTGVPAPKSIRSLSGKDFQSMFRFLVEKLLPNHTYKKKFEDEAMDIIRDLQYPLIDTISPKDFLAIGALHSLSAFYALLNWLMLCCRQKDRLMKLQKSQDEEITSLAESIQSGKLFHSYCVESYKVVLSGNSMDLDPQTRLLRHKFDQAESEIKSNIEQLERKRTLLQKKYDEMMKHKPPLQVLKNQLDILTNDRAKFIKAGEDKRARIEKYKDQNARVQKEIDRMATTRNQMEAERNEILANWRGRGTSLEEIEEVEKFHRQVNAELTEQSTKYEELMRSIHDMEARSAKAKLEIESSIQEYNNKLNMIPDTADDMKITYSEHGKDTREVLNVDMEGDVMPRLENYETELRKQSVHLTEITLKQREQLNGIRMTIEEKAVKLKSDQARIERLNEEYGDAHARAQEKNNKDNMMRDQYEADKKAKEETIHKLHINASNELQEKKRLLDTVSQKVESEKAELEVMLEITEKDIRQALQNMVLTTENLKHEVINCSILNKEV